MHTQQHLESPLHHLIFKNVSVHLSPAEITTIKASRSLPTEWKDDTDLTLAHRLYWAERDWEFAVSSAFRSEVSETP